MELSWANSGLNWPLMDLSGDSWATASRMGPLRASWVSAGQYGQYGPLMGLYGPLRGPKRPLMDIYKPLLALSGLSWATTGHIGLSWASTGHCGPQPASNGHLWASPSLNRPLMGHYGPLMGLYGPYGPLMGHYGPHGPVMGLYWPLRTSTCYVHPPAFRGPLLYVHCGPQLASHGPLRPST